MGSVTTIRNKERLILVGSNRLFFHINWGPNSQPWQLASFKTGHKESEGKRGGSGLLHQVPERDVERLSSTRNGR